MKKRWLILLIAIALIGGIFMFSGLFSRKLYDSEGKLKKDITLEELLSIDYDHGTLLSAEFSTGGGMNGEHYSYTVSREKDGRVILEKKSSSAHYIPLRVYRYEADESVLTALQEYIDRYHLPVWKDLPFDEEMMALDAPTTWIRLTLEDEKSFSGRSFYGISYDNVVPEGGYKILNGFRDLLMSFFEGKEGETFILLDGQEVHTGRDIENTDEEIKALLTGYWRSTKTEFWNVSDGTVSEEVYDDTQFYWFDIGYSGELELVPYGIEGDSAVYTCQGITHEAYPDRDSSWYVEYTREEEIPETLYVTVAGDQLYIDKTYTYADETFRRVYIFERVD